MDDWQHIVSWIGLVLLVWVLVSIPVGLALGRLFRSLNRFIHQP